MTVQRAVTNEKKKKKKNSFMNLKHALRVTAHSVEIRVLLGSTRTCCRDDKFRVIS